MLLTRSPLGYKEQALCSSFDLHVLSTPPAFVLSQDQTLRFKKKSLLALLNADLVDRQFGIYVLNPLVLKARKKRDVVLASCGPAHYLKTSIFNQLSPPQKKVRSQGKLSTHEQNTANHTTVRDSLQDIKDILGS